MESLRPAEDSYRKDVPRRLEASIDVTGPIVAVVIGGPALAVLFPIYRRHNPLR